MKDSLFVVGIFTLFVLGFLLYDTFKTKSR